VTAKHYCWQVFLAVEETPLNRIPAGYMPVSETLLGLDASLKGCSNQVLFSSLALSSYKVSAMQN